MQKNCLQAMNSVPRPSPDLWSKNPLCSTHTRKATKLDTYFKPVRHQTSQFRLYFYVKVVYYQCDLKFIQP